MSGPWDVLREAVGSAQIVYYGRSRVRYSELVQLFDFAREKGGLNYPGKMPAREGGFADVSFPFTEIWTPLFADARAAVANATAGDQPYATRTSFAPAKDLRGNRTFAVGQKDMGPRPRVGGPPERMRNVAPEGEPPKMEREPLWQARPEELYDFVVEAQAVNLRIAPRGPTTSWMPSTPVPPGKKPPKELLPRVSAVRIAWVRADGSSAERAERLQAFLAGRDLPNPAPRQELPSQPEPPQRPVAAEPNVPPSMAGGTAKTGFFRNPKRAEIGEYPKQKQKDTVRRATLGDLYGEIGSPERDAWEMSRPPEKRSELWKKFKRGEWNPTKWIPHKPGEEEPEG